MANMAGLSREELDAQENRVLYINAQRSAVELAAQKGMEKGLKKGI